MGDFAQVYEACEPFVVARPEVVEALDTKPLGVPIPPQNIFNPQHLSSSSFLSLAKSLDSMTYGPLGLRMPDWVFYDCAVMPGAIVGFGRRAQKLEPWLRAGMAISDSYEGLVPVSLFIAIPTPGRERWIGYTLCSINEVAAGGAPEGLWRLTLAMGTASLRIDQMRSTTRWRSPGFGIYGSMGPLELVTAWTPAHDVPETVTFDLETDAAARARLLDTSSVVRVTPHRMLNADNTEEMRALQHEIEAGRRWAIVGPAEIKGARTRVPLADLDAKILEIGHDDVDFRQRFQG